MAEKLVIPIHGGDHCPGGPDPIPCLATSIDFAMLAIPDGQTVPTASLEVVTNFNRSEVAGTALSVNPTTGLITINEAGIYDIHSWAEWDDQGSWLTVEGPVFQGGQDFQDVGNGLHVHTSFIPVAVNVTQHKTTIFCYDTGTNLAPTGLNLQVAHNRGSDDDIVNAGLTVVRLIEYTAS